jgi:hypothetical protein
MGRSWAEAWKEEKTSKELKSINVQTYDIKGS